MSVRREYAANAFALALGRGHHSRSSGLQIDDEAVAITVQREDGQETVSGSFVIGADGGRSFIRKSLGIAFEGFTWEERFIVLTTTFDFETERGCTYRSYFADPNEWVNCFKVAGDGPPGFWRTVFPADLSIPEHELLSDNSVQSRLQAFQPWDAATSPIVSPKQASAK